MKKINYKGLVLLVQAFKKDHFVNLTEQSGLTFSIDFRTFKISTTGKETRMWLQVAYVLNVNELKQLIEEAFNFRYCQSEIELNDKCKVQCSHCEEYYRPLEN
jgi:hypothetical protein